MKFQHLIQAYFQTIPSLSLAEIHGLTRSCLIYYAQPWKWQRLRDFYGAFIQDDDLCFDIGAHVGNRTFFWRMLNARVVAVEPHESSSSFLQKAFHSDSGVTILSCALDAAQGFGQLHIDPSNPTINTLNKDWQQQLMADKSWQSARWNKVQTVPLKTLDQLIAEFGNPKFCKIDVEGSELAVLQGLSQAIPVISFELIPVCREQALACITRLEQLGSYRYNWSPGESLRLTFDHWLDEKAIRKFISQPSQQSKVSGDIIATLNSEQVH